MLVQGRNLQRDQPGMRGLTTPSRRAHPTPQAFPSTGLVEPSGASGSRCPPEGGESPGPVESGCGRGVAGITERGAFLLQECPTGLVDEDTFKLIYSQFFPQGGESEARPPSSSKVPASLWQPCRGWASLLWGGDPHPHTPSPASLARCCLYPAGRGGTPAQDSAAIYRGCWG